MEQRKELKGVSCDITKGPKSRNTCFITNFLFLGILSISGKFADGLETHNCNFGKAFSKGAIQNLAY